jgi:hypothetical protein
MFAFGDGDDSIPEIDGFPNESILLTASHARVQASLKLWHVIGAVTLNDCAQGGLLTVA